jgi:hypothetical protein
MIKLGRPSIVSFDDFIGALQERVRVVERDLAADRP